MLYVCVCVCVCVHAVLNQLIKMVTCSCHSLTVQHILLTGVVIWKDARHKQWTWTVDTYLAVLP